MRNPVATSTVFAKRSAVEEVGGFDEQFRGPEDYDLWMRIAAGQQVIRTDEPLSRYRERPLSLSLDDRTFLPQVLAVIEKAYGPDGVLRCRWGRRRARAYQLLSASWMAANRRAIVRAFALFLKSIAVWPGTFAAGSQMSWVRTKILLHLIRALAGRNRHEVAMSTEQNPQSNCT